MDGVGFFWGPSPQLVQCCVFPLSPRHLPSAPLYVLVSSSRKWSSFVAQDGVQWRDLRSLRLLVSSDSPASAFSIAAITGAHHQTWLIFVF